jgi:hypothetical protein
LATRWKQIEVITAISLQVAMYGSFAGSSLPAVWCGAGQAHLPSFHRHGPTEKPAPELGRRWVLSRTRTWAHVAGVVSRTVHLARRRPRQEDVVAARTGYGASTLPPSKSPRQRYPGRPATARACDRARHPPLRLPGSHAPSSLINLQRICAP